MPCDCFFLSFFSRGDGLKFRCPYLSYWWRSVIRRVRVRALCWLFSHQKHTKRHPFEYIQQLCYIQQVLVRFFWTSKKSKTVQLVLSRYFTEQALQLMKSKDWVARLLCIQMHSITSRTPFRLFRTKIELGEKTWCWKLWIKSCIPLCQNFNPNKMGRGKPLEICGFCQPEKFRVK